MVILTKKTKYDSILEGVHILISESVYGDLKKIGDSKKFTELKSFKDKKYPHLDLGYRIHKITKDTFTLDLDFLVGNKDLDTHAEFIVRCSCKYEDNDGVGNVTINADTVIVESLDAPVVSVLDNFKSFKVKCGVNLVNNKEFDVNSSLSKVVTDACVVALNKVLLDNAQLDKKIEKVTGSAKGFSSVANFLTV